MIHYRRLLMWAAIANLIFTGPAAANDPVVVQHEQEFKVSKLGDTDLHCAALAKEAADMRDIIINNENIEENSQIKSRGISAAGAVGSLLLGTVTAGVGLAAAGFMATEAVDSEANKADSIKELAAQRRSFMVGIYNAKACQGPISYVMRGPVPGPKKTQTPIARQDEKRTAGPIVSRGPASPDAVSPGAGPKPEFSFNE